MQRRGGPTEDDVSSANSMSESPHEESKRGKSTGTRIETAKDGGSPRDVVAAEEGGGSGQHSTSSDEEAGICSGRFPPGE